MKISSIFLICSYFLLAQESYTIISFSPFYTYGKYSDQTPSYSKAVYGSVNFNGDLIFSSGVDLIKLNNKDWSYDQNSMFFSGIKKLSSIYFKVAGAYIKGSYEDVFFSEFNYRDENISLTTELVYDINWNYFGVAYNYFSSSKGFQTLKASNFTLRFDKFLDYNTYISFRPNLYYENSGKKFLSLSSKLTYWFSSDLIANLSFTFGNRRYYFDNDLLTIYNQYDVQKIIAGAGLDYSIIDEITFSGGYQYTKFEKFNINYFFAGFRAKIFF